jgi:ribulose-phosphate 3-epimerase
MTVRIAPSILACDFARLGEEVARVEGGGADLLHVDVMDGHFVPNLTIGPPVIRALHRVAQVPLDVHLMLTDPDRHLEAFVREGAASIAVHVEVLPHLHRTLARIHELGVKAGVAINPSTPVGMLEEVVNDLDFVLMMSVDPGFGGQAFIPGTLQKIRRVRDLLDASGSEAYIQVDGGVDLGNAAAIVQAGASVLVAGSSVFGAADPAEAVGALRRAAMGS